MVEGERPGEKGSVVSERRHSRGVGGRAGSACERRGGRRGGRVVVGKRDGEGEGRGGGFPVATGESWEGTTSSGSSSTRGGRVLVRVLIGELAERRRFRDGMNGSAGERGLVGERRGRFGGGGAGAEDFWEGGC